MYAIRFRKTLAFPHGVRAGRRVAPVRGGRERELNVRPTHHAEMAPAAELLDNRLPAVLKGQPDELPAPAEKSFQKKTRGSQPPFALSGLSPMLQPERPARLSEAVSALLPSWRGLVAFPLPPPASA